MKSKRIPIDILFLAMFYSLQKTKLYPNESKGEIKKIIFSETSNKFYKIGKYITGIEQYDGVDYDVDWVHLARNYYKLVRKVKA